MRPIDKEMRLIDANALANYANNQIVGITANDIMRFPTVKAEEIKGQVTKQAKWEICSDGYYPYCTNCNKEPPSGEMTDYCPNCGADMRYRRGDENE